MVSGGKNAFDAVFGVARWITAVTDHPGVTAGSRCGGGMARNRQFVKFFPCGGCSESLSLWLSETMYLLCVAFFCALACEEIHKRNITLAGPTRACVRSQEKP